MEIKTRLGEFFFRFRDLLPVPLVLALLRFARPHPRTWFLGLPLIALGEILRLWSLMHIGPTTRTRKISADRLTTSGPYAFTRNPLYLANLVKILGILVVAGNGPMALLILAFYGLEFPSLIHYEESFLAERFPQAHAEYVKLVPAFFPDPPKSHGWRNCLGADHAPYSFGEAWHSERRTFSSTGLILAALGIVQFFRPAAVGSGEMISCS